MKQNNLNIISTTMMALVLAVMSAQAAGAVTVITVGFPTDIAVDGAGNIYVTDTRLNDVHKINIDGTYQAVGTGLIDFPSGVALGDGKIYVADDSNNSIEVFNSTGALVQTVGIGQLNSPEGVAVDSAGNVYVADSNNSRIQIFKSGGSVQTVGSGQLNFPSGVTVDSAGNIYVADSGNNRIQKFNSTGSLVQTVGTVFLKFPNGLALDGAGNIYAADTGHDRVVVFNPDGSFKQAIGSLGAGDGQFNLPMGVAVDSAGTKIYVADAGNDRVQVLALSTGVTGFSAGNGVQGSTIEARVNVTNGPAAQTYVIVISGTNATGFPLAGTGTVTLAAGQSMNNVLMLVAVPAVQPVGDYSLIATIYKPEDYPAQEIMSRGPVTATVVS